MADQLYGPTYRQMPRFWPWSRKKYKVYLLRGADTPRLVAEEVCLSCAKAICQSIKDHRISP